LELEGTEMVEADLVDAKNPLRHDPKKLAQALMRLYYDKAEVASQPRAARPRDLEMGTGIESA
jgi:hypothetical protein